VRRERFSSPPIRLPVQPGGRVTLTLTGVDQGNGSFGVHVFVNDDHADASTPRDAAHGFVGTVWVYGIGTGASMPTDRTLDATEAVHRLRAPTVTVTLVAVDADGKPARLLELDGVTMALG
jgi:hypothetical protein